MTVIEEVVAKGWCIGCGMCTSVCPKDRLEILWNDRGEYNPVVVDNAPTCGETCSLCYQVCPAHGNTRNETEIGKALYDKVDGIQHTPETGYHLSSYVGYSKEHRLTSASGGLASWVLESLLESGEVDGVLAVGRTTDSDKLFEFKICSTKAEVRACGRSAYYPVEVSEVIRHVLKNEGQYAIIGLPCVCKAIRLAQDKLPKLKKRIKYILGLTCGHTCSKFFAEYICALGGGNPHNLKEFIFRTKDLKQPASNHQMTFCSTEGSEDVLRNILWNKGVGSAFTNGYFQLPGCFYCDDIFAECADAVFMDAWLPEYSKQSEGYTIALTRNSRINALLVFGTERDFIKSSKLPIGETITSQLSIIECKRCRTINLKGDPKQRTELFKHPTITQRLQAVRLRSYAQTSVAKWKISKMQLRKFRTLIHPLHKKMIFISMIQRTLSLPNNTVERVVNLLKGDLP